MAKRSVNLIISKRDFSETAEKLKRITTITAGISIVLFLLLFALSVWYVRTNTDKFTQMKQELDQVEKKVAAKKQAEGLYVLTSQRLSVLEKLLAQTSPYDGLIGNIAGLSTEGISITSVTADSRGNLSISILASSSASLDAFITSLLYAEQEKRLSKIFAQGILRHEEGDYSLTLLFHGEKNLYQ
ncbi:hypothetical protein HYW55_01825 [Candidatus Gottesmanbacteria bacterium]|nr:hypothetical protein [Candidatus Gottesmanbacteria bacterium]